MWKEQEKQGEKRYKRDGRRSGEDQKVAVVTNH